MLVRIGIAPSAKIDLSILNRRPFLVRTHPGRHIFIQIQDAGLAFPASRRESASLIRQVNARRRCCSYKKPPPRPASQRPAHAVRGSPFAGQTYTISSQPARARARARASACCAVPQFAPPPPPGSSQVPRAVGRPPRACRGHEAVDERRHVEAHHELRVLVPAAQERVLSPVWCGAGADDSRSNGSRTGRARPLRRRAKRLAGAAASGEEGAAAARGRALAQAPDAADCACASRRTPARACPGAVFHIASVMSYEHEKRTFSLCGLHFTLLRGAAGREQGGQTESCRASPSGTLSVSQANNSAARAAAAALRAPHGVRVSREDVQRLRRVPHVLRARGCSGCVNALLPSSRALENGSPPPLPPPRRSALSPPPLQPPIHPPARPGDPEEGAQRGPARAQVRMVLSTDPVARTQSLYLFQSHESTSYSCAGSVRVLKGWRLSHTFTVQSPEAVANTSAVAGFLLDGGGISRAWNRRITPAARHGRGEGEEDEMRRAEALGHPLAMRRGMLRGGEAEAPGGSTPRGAVEAAAVLLEGAEGVRVAEGPELGREVPAGGHEAVPPDEVIRHRVHLCRDDRRDR